MSLSNLTVKIYNKTGHDIDSLIVGATFIGHLSIGDSTNLIRFRKFHFDSGYPYETVKGNFKSKVLTQLFWSWCGTKRYTKADSSYCFDLKTQDNKGKSYLYLDNHNEDLFNW